MRIEEGQMAMTGPRKWRARGGKISVTGILTGLFLCFVLTSSSWGGVPVDLQKKIGKAVDKGKNTSTIASLSEVPIKMLDWPITPVPIPRVSWHSTCTLSTKWVFLPTIGIWKPASAVSPG